MVQRYIPLSFLTPRLSLGQKSCQDVVATRAGPAALVPGWWAPPKAMPFLWRVKPTKWCAERCLVLISSPWLQIKIVLCLSRKRHLEKELEYA